MNLTILERISIPQILKQEGNYAYMILREDIVNKTKLTQQEIKDNNFRQEGSSLVWENGEKTFPIEFTTLEHNEMRKACEKLEQESKITSDTLSLYKKFVIDPKA